MGQQLGLQMGRQKVIQLEPPMVIELVQMMGILMDSLWVLMLGPPTDLQ